MNTSTFLTTMKLPKINFNEGGKWLTLWFDLQSPMIFRVWFGPLVKSGLLGSISVAVYNPFREVSMDQLPIEFDALIDAGQYRDFLDDIEAQGLYVIDWEVWPEGIYNERVDSLGKWWVDN